MWTTAVVGASHNIRRLEAHREDLGFTPAQIILHCSARSTNCQHFTRDVHHIDTAGQPISAEELARLKKQQRRKNPSTAATATACVGQASRKGKVCQMAPVCWWYRSSQWWRHSSSSLWGYIRAGTGYCHRRIIWFWMGHRGARWSSNGARACIAAGPCRSCGQ